MSDSNITLDSIIHFVLDCVAEQVNADRATLAADTSLASVGVDSLAAVLLCGLFEDEYDLEIEPMVMFEHKTAHQVANALLEMM